MLLVLIQPIEVSSPYRKADYPFQELIERTSRKHSIAPSLVRAVIAVESKFDPQAKSKAGAKGLMQITAITAKHLSLTEPMHPAKNVDAGTRYLVELHKRFGGDWKLALAAYNAGPTAVRKAGNRIPNYTETKAYVKKVMALKQQFESQG